MSISIGYGKAYDWSKGTSLSLKPVNNSDFGLTDGWLTLDSITPYASQPFDDFTGWTEQNTTGGDCSVDPASVCKLLTTSSNGSQAGIYKVPFGNSSTDETWAMDYLLKMTAIPTKTEVGAGYYTRFQIIYKDGVSTWYPTLCTDAGNLVIHYYTAGYANNYVDTGIVKDSRVHNIIVRHNSGTTAEVLLDGTVVATISRFGADATQKGYADILGYVDRANVISVSVDYVNNIGSYTNYVTTDSTWTSTASDPIFDAGANRRWKNFTATVDTSNSTNITYRVRCASSVANLSSAVYESILSGADISTRGRFIQVEITLQDASSGQYTPILKDITLTDEPFSSAPSITIVGDTTPLTATSIGYGKTYDWTKGVSTNLQDTNITTATGQNGYKLLSHSAPTIAKIWSDFTSWTESSDAGSDASTDGTEYTSYSNNAGSVACMNNTGFVGATTWAVAFLAKIIVPGTTTATDNGNRSGIHFITSSTTRYTLVSIRSDGTNIDVYANYDNSWTMNKYDTAFPVDTTKYHLFEFYSANENNNMKLSIDGIEYLSGMSTANNNALAGTYQIGTRKGTVESNNPQTKLRFTHYFNTTTRYITTDATWESTYNDSIFNAGTGKVWKTINWNATTDNGTVIKIEVRCASSADGLASSTYTEITNGSDIVNRNQFIQIRATMSDAGSGQYTPILKDISLTPERLPFRITL